MIYNKIYYRFISGFIILLFINSICNYHSRLVNLYDFTDSTICLNGFYDIESCNLETFNMQNTIY